MVCDSLVRDELSFEWAEAVFGAFGDSSDAPCEIIDVSKDLIFICF